MCQKLRQPALAQQSYEDLPRPHSIGVWSFFANDILGELVTTLRNNKFLQVISDWFFKLFHTILLRSVTVMSMAKPFVTHSVTVYGPPQRLLSDNVRQVTSKFFGHVCKILGIENVFMTMYHPQTSDLFEWYNRTIIS